MIKYIYVVECICCNTLTNVMRVKAGAFSNKKAAQEYFNDVAYKYQRNSRAYPETYTDFRLIGNTLCECELCNGDCISIHLQALQVFDTSGVIPY